MTLHEQCRTAVLDDDATPAAVRHLQRCGPCRRFADRVRRVTAAAPSLAPGDAPAGLADRVIAGVPGLQAAGHAASRPAAVRAAGPAGVPLRRRRLRLPVLPTALTAAAAAVLATVVVVGPTSEDPREVLLAAASSTEAAGSGRVEVRAEAHLTAPAGPGGSPRFAQFPAEVQPYVEAQWAEMMRRFDEQMEEFVRRTEQSLDDALAQMDRELDRMFEQLPGTSPGGRPPAPVSPPSPAEPGRAGEPPAPEQPPAAPSALTVRVDVAGTGEVDFDEALHVAGSVRASGDGAAPASASFDLTAAPDGVRVDAGGRSAAVPATASPLGGLLLRPDAALRALRSPSGDVEALGEVDVDGERVRRYRFAVEASALGVRGDARYWAQASVDSSDRLRELVLESSGEQAPDGLRWRTRTALSLSALGTPVEPAAVPAPPSTAEAPEGSSALLHPFGPSLTAAVRGRS